MAQRNWDRLSDSYRSRLERSGISREDYQSGQSLRAARGHATTPEHPGQGLSNPQFRSYYSERAEEHVESLQDRLAKRGKEVFGDTHKWITSGGLAFDLDNPPEGAPEVTYEDILEIIYMTDDELEYFITHDPRAWVLYYHGKK